MNTYANSVNDERFNSVPVDRWLDANEIRLGQFLAVAHVTMASFPNHACCNSST